MASPAKFRIDVAIHDLLIEFSSNSASTSNRNGRIPPDAGISAVSQKTHRPKAEREASKIRHLLVAIPTGGIGSPR